MRISKQLIGGCALAFGVGVIFTAFLPLGAMIVIEGVVVIGAGVLAFCR